MRCVVEKESWARVVHTAGARGYTEKLRTYGGGGAESRARCRTTADCIFNSAAAGHDAARGVVPWRRRAVCKWPGLRARRCMCAAMCCLCVEGVVGAVCAVLALTLEEAGRGTREGGGAGHVAPTRISNPV